MVQDYIGNLNVLLAVPFLAIGGINTVALRAPAPRALPRSR